MSQYKEVRKIQFTARSTYAISLPKEWIEEMNLEAGDPVTMIRESDNSIIMLPNIVEKSPEINEARILLSPDDDSIDAKNKVTAAYLAGYNVVNVRGTSKRIDSAQRDAIRSLAKQDVIGTELIYDAADGITLQVLQSLPQLSVKSAVQRMHAIASQMHSDAVTSLVKNDAELARQVRNTLSELQRFELYVSRNLVLGLQNSSIRRQAGLRNPSDCLNHQAAVKSIRQVGDNASRIAAYCQKGRQPLPKDLMQRIGKISEALMSSFSDSVSALLKFDYTLAADASQRLSLAQNIAGSLILSKDHNSFLAIAEILVNTARAVDEISQFAIRQTLDQFLDTARKGSS